MKTPENIQTRGEQPAGGRAVWLAVAWSIGSLAVLVVVLAGLKIDSSAPATLEAGSRNIRELWPFWLASASCWLGLTGLWWLLSRKRAETTRRSFIVIAGFIMLVGGAARVAALETHEPTLSDDVYRYVFDGRNMAAGINPYLPTPADRTAAACEAWPGEDMLVGTAAGTEHHCPGQINNPHLHTIYLPTSQWCFGALGRLPVAPVDGVRAFRWGFVAVELVMIALLLVAVYRAGRSAWWVALYAWHPLPLTEIAGSGHQDILGIALLVGALLLFDAAPKQTWRWTAALAAGVLVKPVVLPVAAYMVKGRPLKAWLVSAAVGIVVCLVIAGPLWFSHGGQPLANLLDTATTFSTKWASFGSVYQPLLGVIERMLPTGASWSGANQQTLAKLICLGLIGFVAIAAFLSRRNAWESARIVLLAMVLFSTTAHPWYLLWCFALAPMAISPAVWVASLTISWAYATWGYTTSCTGDIVWGTATWVIAAAYIPIYIALGIDLLSRRQHMADRIL